MTNLANIKTSLVRIYSRLKAPRILIPLSIFIVLIVIASTILILKKSETPPVASSESEPGKCLVLEEKFCGQGYLVELNGEFIGVGFMLPEGTPVFADSAGNAQRIDYSLIGQSFPAIESNPTSSDIEATLILRSSSITATGIETKKGEKIATLTEESLGINGDYNLIVFFSKADKVDKELTLTNFGL